MKLSTILALSLALIALAILGVVNPGTAKPIAGDSTELHSSAPFVEEPFELSLAGAMAIGPHNAVLWDGGFGFNYLVADGLRFGFENLGVASSTLLSGSRYGLSIAPMVEYHYNLSRYFAAVGAVGLPLQARFGADLDTKLGLQPYARVGFDYITGKLFSIGLTERAGYVLSDAYVMENHVLPKKAGVFTTGVVLKFHF